jgi:hypothetical protein
MQPGGMPPGAGGSRPGTGQGMQPPLGGGGPRPGAPNTGNLFGNSNADPLGGQGRGK